MPTLSPGDSDSAALHAQLAELYDATPGRIRVALAGLIRHSSPRLAARFYEVMLEQPTARFYLDHAIVTQRLQTALQQWLQDLFPRKETDAARIFRRQGEIGVIHSRMQVPVALVMRGFREIKRDILADLEQTRMPREDIVIAVRFVSELLDIALDVMTAVYMGRSERAVRTDEAFRLYSIGQDMGLEKERQRRTLAEWTGAFFFQALAATGNSSLPLLSESEFGLWFSHRADVLFGTSGEYRLIQNTIAEIGDLSMKLLSLCGTERETLLWDIKNRVDRVGMLLTMLFDGCIQADGARDSLTRMLHRRFLLTVLSREISTQKSIHRPFSIVFLKIDNLERARERVGDTGVEAMLQQTAALLFNSTRSSDSVFNMGRDMFLIVRVASDADQTLKFARAIAARYAAVHFEVNGEVIRDNSITFGIAEYDGHPDPRYLIDRAQKALRENVRAPA